MNNFSCINLSSSICTDHPFPHFSSALVFQNDVDSQLFDWFENTNSWSLTNAEFYDQYEFSFFNTEIPTHLQCIISAQTINTIQEKLKSVFDVKHFELVGVTAHKLVHDQRIGIHNDFIGEEETHRLVIHINPNWQDENGGLLVLFNSDKAEDITKIIKPVNNSALGFEISQRSNHAVSKVYNFTRYSIVYTFAARKDSL
ncbi:MAG: cyclophane-containing peptide 2OG-Fe(II) oxygenase YhhC [Saprospiraceae bacterium]